MAPHKLQVRWPVGRELTPLLDRSKGGYLTVRMSKRRRSLATIVASAFLGQRPRGMQINHIDGNKTNNDVSNLEYVSLARNIRHSWDLGLRDPMKWSGEKNGKAKLTDEAVKEIRAGGERAWRYKAKNLAEKYNVDVTLVRMVRRREIWRHLP